MKISLIIPVYNVEDYLGRCLDSVEKQTYKDAEVIIINDGSTDNSYKIIEEYVSRNDNFTCYTIENSGLGGARNYGMERAKGEYIVFLDSDDYIAYDCLEKLIAAAENNDSDIVVCNNYDVKEDGTVISLSQSYIKNKTTSLAESPLILLNRPCAWAKMYRRALIEGLSFVSRVWYEDMRLIPKLYQRASKITFIDDALFYYVQRKGSIMNNSKATRNLEIIEAFEDLVSYYENAGVYSQFRSEFEYLVIDHIAVAAVTRVVLSNAAEKRAVIKKLQDYVTRFEGLGSNKYISYLGFNKKLVWFFNRHKLYFLTALCMKAKSILK